MSYNAQGLVGKRTDAFDDLRILTVTFIVCKGHVLLILKKKDQYWVFGMDITF